jgi:hypothetical protein
MNISHGITKNGNLYQAIQNQIVPQYVSKQARKIVEEILKISEIAPEEKNRNSLAENSSRDEKENVYPHLAPITTISPEIIHFIPKILYFENERHENLLSEMTSAFKAGEHLLLIGNQGTGIRREEGRAGGRGKEGGREGGRRESGPKVFFR